MIRVRFRVKDGVRVSCISGYGPSINTAEGGGGGRTSTHIQTHIHTHVHTFIHSYIHTYIYLYITQMDLTMITLDREY